MNKQIFILFIVGLTTLLTACGGSKSDKTPIPELNEQSKLGTQHTLTPEYTFTSTLAGTINYAGACASETTQAKAGENTITFNNLEWWESYNNCEITVTSDKGKISPILKITPFEVIPKPTEINKLGEVFTLTPEYTFHTDIAGTITYQGRCSSDTTQATVGENEVKLKLSKWWITYDDCALTITTADGKTTSQLSISPFRTVYPAKHPLSDTGMTLCANYPRYADGSFPEPDRHDNYTEFKVGISCADFGVTQTEDGWDGEFVIPAGQDATHGRDTLAAQGKLEKVGAGHGGYDFTKLDKDGNELDYSEENYACIRDNHTGLTWEVKTEGHRRSDLHSGKAKYLWYNSDPETNGGLEGFSSTADDSYYCSIEQCNTEKFIEVVNADSYCGLSNWRLPAYIEIASISNVQSVDDEMEHYVESPILRHAYTYNLTSDFVKKDSYRHIILSHRLSLYFPAFIQPDTWETITDLNSAVLVSEPSDYQVPLNNDEKYEALTEATVLDKNTGLIWTRCPAIMKGDNNICDTLYYWDEALAAVQTANSNDFLGYSDWRLPSIHELTSLHAFDRIPMINKKFFPIDDIENKSFWSSTPSVRDWDTLAGIQIIHFNFYEERISPSKLDKEHYVLLVRGGK